MSTSTSSTVSFSAINDPSDVLVGVADVHPSSSPMSALGQRSVDPLKNVEENQQVDVGESVIRVTTLSQSVINDSQKQPSQAQITINTLGGNKFSKVFHAAVENADTILQSSDGVFFNVNFAIVSHASNNAFGSTLQANVARALVIDELSETLNIILRAVYDWPSDQSSPSLQALLDAVDRMPHYGLSVQQLVQPATDIFALLSSMAVEHPLEIYTLAAHHSLHALAVFASSHLLSRDISTLTNHSIDKMGPTYLRRLIQLHVSRISALRDILGVYPAFEHEECIDAAKKAWAYGTLDVLKASKADYPAERISCTMLGYAQGIKCIRCRQTFSEAVSNAVARWAVVPATI